ncbi:hypothetical protein HHI36_021786 [Cryptolaemus montrouzieri]|uniref:Uncharacterized protein n=1 Tax=Cryptolaemus montrouzieri TaxID=559131 RepID=A0ABD2MYL6_9CUCU
MSRTMYYILNLAIVSVLLQATSVSGIVVSSKPPKRLAIEIPQQHHKRWYPWEEPQKPCPKPSDEVDSIDDSKSWEYLKIKNSDKLREILESSNVYNHDDSSASSHEQGESAESLVVEIGNGDHDNSKQSSEIQDLYENEKKCLELLWIILLLGNEDVLGYERQRGLAKNKKVSERCLKSLIDFITQIFGFKL